MQLGRAMLLLSVVLIGASSACSSASAPADVPSVQVADSDHDFDAMLNQYEDTLASLELPADAPITAPVDPGPEKLPDGTFGTTVYEPGYGMTVAHMHWFCAWEAEWLALRGVDDAAAGEALATLEGIYETETYARFMDQGVQDAIRRSLEDAALGDPTGIKADVDANCR